SNGSTGNSITVKPFVSTQYTAVCKLSEGCVSAVSNSIAVSVGKAAPPVLACSTDMVCPGASVTLKAYGCSGIVTWSNGQTGNSITVTLQNNTKFSAYCSIGDCQSESSEHLEIAVGVPGKPFVTCKTKVLCLGESSSLTAAGCTGTV